MLPARFALCRDWVLPLQATSEVCSSLSSHFSVAELLGSLLAKRPFVHYLYSGRTHQLGLLSLQSLMPAIYTMYMYQSISKCLAMLAKMLLQLYSEQGDNMLPMFD